MRGVRLKTTTIEAVPPACCVLSLASYTVHDDHSLQGVCAEGAGHGTSVGARVGHVGPLDGQDGAGLRGPHQHIAVMVDARRQAGLWMEVIFKGDNIRAPGVSVISHCEPFYNCHVTTV